LARVALDCALAVPDVVGAEAGAGVPRITAGGSELLIGVSATAQSDGRYAVDLRLIARLVPLQALAERVRTAVRDAAARAGLAASLGSISVEFVDVMTSEELARPIAVADPVAPAVSPPPLLPDPQAPPPAAQAVPGAPHPPVPGAPDLPGPGAPDLPESLG
jgi:hypothetical protein